MICKVIETIEKYELLKGVKSVAVGFSGGADSLCLLHILSRIKDRYGIILKAVHVNHNLRGEAALSDERTVRKICGEMGIELLVFSEDISALAKDKGIGLEECGRLIRYECFEKANCDAVATAHNLNDRMETMIFNLVRGTSLRGLSSIPPKREPNIIRPLIDCTRQEIETYCEENNLIYVTDATNFSDDYTRNYIRHNIIPSFERINSSYEVSLSRAMESFREENIFLEELTADLISEALIEGGYKTEVIAGAHPALKKRAVEVIISSRMSKSPERRHIYLAEKAVEQKKGKVQLGEDLYICVNSDIIAFQCKAPEKEFFEWEIINNSVSTPKGRFKLEITENPKELLPQDIDAEKLSGELKFTSRREGDSFYSEKRRNTKSLKKLFNEMKIPAGERHLIPVFRCDEGAVWVYGIGTDGRFAAKEGTKKIIRIKKEG